MVTNKRKWAVGSDEWTRDAAPDRLSEPALGHVAGPDRGHLLETTGIFWESVDLTDIQPSGRDRARARLRAALPELIWNDAALEGNNFTLPEVRTLLDGVTVGGKKLRMSSRSSPSARHTTSSTDVSPTASSHWTTTRCAACTASSPGTSRWTQACSAVRGRSPEGGPSD